MDAANPVFDLEMAERVVPPSPPDDLLLWQLADSAFPVGGFAHSGGLESAVQHGSVKNGADLREFCEASLTQIGRSQLPLMVAAFDAPEDLRKLNETCECFLTNHVANRASKLQAQALVASTARIFKSQLAEANWRINEMGADVHLAPVFGALMSNLAVDKTKAARLFLFWHLRGWCASAVRLNIIGPLEAQSIQVSLGPILEHTLTKFINLDASQIAQTSPLLDLCQGTQDRLYSRLFQS